MITQLEKNMEAVKLISSSQIHKCLKYKDLIPAMLEAFREYSECPLSHPSKLVVPLEKVNGNFFVMPAYSKNNDTLSTKLLSVIPRSHNGNHIMQSYLLIFDSKNGRLTHLMEAEEISTMKTAASTVAATQALVSKKPKILGIVGSGRQARSHLLAFSKTYTFEKIKIWGRNPENVKKLCDEMEPLQLHPCTTAEEAVRGSDIVVSVTRSPVPVVMGKWLKPGSHYNCIGACTAKFRETDDDCMKNSVVYVDSRKMAKTQSGDIIDSKAEIYAEVGEILSGKIPVKNGNRTLFKSSGLAIQDAYAARIILDKLPVEESRL